MLRLENWAYVYTNQYYPKSVQQPRFTGQVYNHPHHVDGTIVTTSPMIAFKDGIFKSRSGNLYELGQPKSDYEAMFPNALQRMLDRARQTLPEF